MIGLVLLGVVVVLVPAVVVFVALSLAGLSVVALSGADGLPAAGGRPTLVSRRLDPASPH
jgi:hypothetical protein